MYQTLLVLHSWVRWLVLAGLLLSVALAWYGWFSKKRFTARDNTIRQLTATIAHIQLVLGLWLYCVSPIIRYFFRQFSTAMHDRGTRFFGMEHITMMLLGITLITIGSAKAKRKTADREKFKTMAIWFTVALLVILSSVPWSFSPLISRPNFRTF